MQYACAILSSLACPDPLHFPTISHIRNIKCVLIFSTAFFSPWSISHSKKKWAIYDQKCISVFTYSACYSCPILTKFEFSRQSFGKKNPQIPNFMKIRPVWAGLLHAARLTDMTKLIVTFRNFFAKRPKNFTFCPHCIHMCCIYPRINKDVCPT